MRTRSTLRRMIVLLELVILVAATASINQDVPVNIRPKRYMIAYFDNMGILLLGNGNVIPLVSTVKPVACNVKIRLNDNLTSDWTALALSRQYAALYEFQAVSEIAIIRSNRAATHGNTDTLLIFDDFEIELIPACFIEEPAAPDEPYEFRSVNVEVSAGQAESTNLTQKLYQIAYAYDTGIYLRQPNKTEAIMLYDVTMPPACDVEFRINTVPAPEWTAKLNRARGDSEKNESILLNLWTTDNVLVINNSYERVSLKFDDSIIELIFSDCVYWSSDGG